MAALLGTQHDAVGNLLDALTQPQYTAAPRTHFPVQLPLAFPSPLHRLNLVCILHIVHAAVSQPQHTLYLAEANTTARDLVLRGVMAAFLASDESWNSENALAAAAWSAGKMDEARVAELFGIEVMRERQHESLPVKVGERWSPGVGLAQELVAVFARMGRAIAARQGRCVGDAAVSALKAAGEQVRDIRGDKGPAFASVFCDKAVAFEKVLADPYPAASGKVMPAAPLGLLQDLSRFPSAELEALDLTLPRPHDVSNVSPLPLPLTFILFAGLIDLDPDSEPQDDPNPESYSTPEIAALRALSAPNPLKELYKLTRRDDAAVARTPRARVEVSLQTYLDLQTASVELCRDVWAAARFAPGHEGDAWKRDLSMADVARLFVSFEELRHGGRLAQEVVVK